MSELANTCIETSRAPNQNPGILLVFEKVSVQILPTSIIPRLEIQSSTGTDHLPYCPHSQIARKYTVAAASRPVRALRGELAPVLCVRVMGRFFVIMP